MGKKMGFLGFGSLFGFALSRVGASEFDLIFGMFIGQNFKLVGVIGTAIVVGFIGMRLLKSYQPKALNGEDIEVSYRKLGTYSKFGGILFGLGWGIAGACPGTALVQLGEGKIFGLFTVLGLILGTYLYAILKERISEL